MSANDNFSLHDDEELSLHDDASLDGSVPASNKGDAPAKPPQIHFQTSNCPSFKKMINDRWARRWKHYLGFFLQHTGRKQFADEKERMQETLLLMAVPRSSQRFHGMDDARDFGADIKTRFGGNAELKEMQKCCFKQQCEAFTIFHLRKVGERVDSSKKLLYIVDALGAGVSSYIQKTSSSSLTSDNVAFLSQAKASSSKHKPSHSSGSYSSYTTSSSKATPTATPGLADEVIHSFLATNADDVDLIHEDLDQIDDLDLEEMDINWQIAMTAIKIKKFYKKTGRRPRVDGKMHVAFDKRKVECFNCHNTGHFARECKFKGSKEGSRQEAGKGQNFKPVQIEKEALMTIDEGLDSYNALQAKYDELQSEFGDQEAALVAHKLAVKKLESQLKASHKQQSSLNEKLNFQANQIFEKDEKLKKYRRIGMKSLSTVKLGLGHSIKSNAEVLGYEEEMSRGIFVLRETDAGYYDIPLYSRFKQVEYKGVPHPLSGDYTPRAQEDIDDSLYVYGKHGPQPQSPSPTVSNASSIVFSICPSNDSDGELGAVSDASSTHYSTCQSNDSDGELGTVTDHSVNDDLIHDQAPIPSIEQVTIATQKTQPQVPKPFFE
ncbi:ribonuclease H-like domain-containing protein [Tanacetum coccineum]